MSRLRILVLAPFCDPEAVSMPYVTYSHAAALAQLHDVTLVVGAPVEDHVRRARASFAPSRWCGCPRSNASMPGVSHDLQMQLRHSGVDRLRYPFSLAFEWYAWRQLRRRIFAGEFDVVLRILPMTAVLPSPFAFFLRKGPIPFVIGPLNGGLPWPPGFSQLEKEGMGLRPGDLYRFLPFARSTYRDAAAIIAASSQTCAEFAQYRDKLFFVPENGICPLPVLR